MSFYNPNDVIVPQVNDHGSFNETVISASVNGVLIFDSNSKITTISTSSSLFLSNGSSSWASASLSSSFANTAGFTISSSYLNPNSVNGNNAKFPSPFSVTYVSSSSESTTNVTLDLPYTLVDMTYAGQEPAYLNLDAGADGNCYVDIDFSAPIDYASAINLDIGGNIFSATAGSGVSVHQYLNLASSAIQFSWATYDFNQFEINQLKITKTITVVTNTTLDAFNVNANGSCTSSIGIRGVITNALQAVSSSFTTTASFATVAKSASWAPQVPSDTSISSSWASSSISASYAGTSTNAGFANNATSATSASYASVSTSASFANNAMVAVSASISSTSSIAISASYARTASLARTASFATLALSANTATLAYARMTGSNLAVGTYDTIPNVGLGYIVGGLTIGNRYRYIPGVNEDYLINGLSSYYTATDFIAQDTGSILMAAGGVGIGFDVTARVNEVLILTPLEVVATTVNSSISSSWTSQSLSSSWVPNLYPQVTQASASYASASTSASFANNAMVAVSASFSFTSSIAVSASYARSASLARTASFATFALSANTATLAYARMTGSNLAVGTYDTIPNVGLGYIVGGLTIGNRYRYIPGINEDYLINGLSSYYTATDFIAQDTGSILMAAGGVGIGFDVTAMVNEVLILTPLEVVTTTINSSISSSWASSSISASYASTSTNATSATSASYASASTSASFANNATSATSASYASASTSASFANNATSATSASYASASTSASFTNNAMVAVSASISVTSSIAVSASYARSASLARTASFATFALSANTATLAYARMTGSNLAVGTYDTIPNVGLGYIVGGLTIGNRYRYIPGINEDYLINGLSSYYTATDFIAQDTGSTLIAAGGVGIGFDVTAMVNEVLILTPLEVVTTTINSSISSSWASQSLHTVSASYASESISSSYATAALNSTSASYAITAISASWAPSTPSYTATSASWASQSLSASYLVNNQRFVDESLAIAYAIAL